MNLEISVAETSDDSLFREIDEELKQEKFTKLWKQYGSYLIAGVVVLIAAVGGYQAWKEYDIRTRMAEGEQFAAALSMVRDGKADDAIEAFATLGRDAGGGYSMLARFQQAGRISEKGDRAKAAELYRRIADDNGFDLIYRDLAVILGTLNEMGGGGDTAALRRQLAPLTANDNPWRFSAKELSAVLALEGGDKAQARETFSALVEDTSAPAGIRARAREILSTLSD